jgi:hypothetical protein
MRVPKLSASWQKKPWVSEAEARKIASTPLSERLNLMTLPNPPLLKRVTE